MMAQLIAYTFLVKAAYEMLSKIRNPPHHTFTGRTFQIVGVEKRQHGFTAKRESSQDFQGRVNRRLVEVHADSKPGKECRLLR